MAILDSCANRGIPHSLRHYKIVAILTASPLLVVPRPSIRKEEEGLEDIVQHHTMG